MKIEEDISKTFDTLKLGSICFVFFGHFFNNYPLLWIPVTTALIVFSFTSGYFTHRKYHDHLNPVIFWKSKVKRLGINLTIINSFLLAVFILRHEAGIWTWHTVVNLLGMNGFLNWFHITNVSPYGKGMWFFTLLLLFYLAYPALRQIPSQHCNLIFPIALILLYVCSRIHNPGHALYLTLSGFIAGVYIGGLPVMPVPPLVSAVFCILSFFAMLVLNTKFALNQLNFFFIFSFSIFFILCIVKIKIPDSLYRWISLFSPCIFGIYLIHPYFSLRPTGITIIDFLLSFVTVLLISMGLHQIEKRVVQR